MGYTTGYSRAEQCLQSDSINKLNFHYREMGTGKRRLYSEMNDDQLDGEIRTITAGNPNMGYRSVLGSLRANGKFVQESRVQNSLLRINPVAVALR